MIYTKTNTMTNGQCYFQGITFIYIGSTFKHIISYTTHHHRLLCSSLFPKDVCITSALADTTHEDVYFSHHNYLALIIFVMSQLMISYGNYLTRHCYMKISCVCEDITISPLFLYVSRYRHVPTDVYYAVTYPFW